MDSQQQKKSWGGQRPGAGRPGTDSRTYTFRAPAVMADFIDAQPEKTAFIRRCISRAMYEGCYDERLPLGCPVPVSGMKAVSLPFFDLKIAAGFPIPLDNDERSQDIDLLSVLCPCPESTYIMKVEGDSMINAGICSGDIIMVDKSNRNPLESEVAVCEYNGEYTLKHFVKRDGCAWLVPANPAYKPIQVSVADDLSIWGTVTYVIHKPKG